MLTESVRETADNAVWCFKSGVSWRGIFAGVITAIAVGIVLSLLGIALGFKVVNPMTSHPLAGVGITMGIWTLVSGIVSLAAGGFVAGLFSGHRGAVHGFLVWAAVLIVGVFSTSIAAGTLVQGLGGMLSGAGSVASSVAEGVGEVTKHGISMVQKNNEGSRESPRILSILRDTGIRELQPAFFMGQLSEIRRDLAGSLRQMTAENYENVIRDFLERQKQRLNTLQSVKIDRDAAIRALMKERNISAEQAARLLDEALDLYAYRVDQITSAVDQAEQQMQEVKQYIRQAREEARRLAEEAADAAAKSALMAAVALILGAVAGILGGICGLRCGHRCKLMEQ